MKYAPTKRRLDNVAKALGCERHIRTHLDILQIDKETCTPERYAIAVRGAFFDSRRTPRQLHNRSEARLEEDHALASIDAALYGNRKGGVR